MTAGRHENLHEVGLLARHRVEGEGHREGPEEHAEEEPPDRFVTPTSEHERETEPDQGPEDEHSKQNKVSAHRDLPSDLRVAPDRRRHQG